MIKIQFEMELYESKNAKSSIREETESVGNEFNFVK